MRRIAAALLVTLLLLLAAGCGQRQESSPNSKENFTESDKDSDIKDIDTNKITLKISSLKGPTSMGLVKLKADSEAGKTAAAYDIQVVTAADEVTAALATGKTDIALLPANAAAALYSRAGGFKIAAINNLGVLHIVENGSSIRVPADLAGRTVVLTGKGTTPEYALRTVLKAAGIEDQVTLEFRSEAAEVVAALTAEVTAVGLLPEPFVTAALLQEPSLRRALDLNAAWEETVPDSALVTGVLVIRNEILTQQPEVIRSFLKEYEASVEFSREQPASAAEGIVSLGIVGKAAIAEKALPGCNLKCITGEEMKTLVSAYLQTLYDQDPASLGGALPDEDFWYLYEE